MLLFTLSYLSFACSECSPRAYELGACVLYHNSAASFHLGDSSSLERMKRDTWLTS